MPVVQPAPLSSPRPAGAADAAPRPRKPGRSWYRYAARLLPVDDPPGPWVDLGCGQGELLERGWSGARPAVGLDIDPPNAASAARFGAAGCRADLGRGLPFRDGSLAGVTLIEVVEHVFEAERLLADVARALRPGGWLVLTTPNVASWRYRLAALRGHPPKQEGYHVRFFTRALLRQTLEAAGFRLEAVASYGSSRLLGRFTGPGRPRKLRLRVPAALEPVWADHFVWRLRRV